TTKSWRLIVEEVPEGILAAESDCDRAIDARIAVLADQPNEIQLEVVAERDGWLFMADTWYPGWSAFLGEVEIPLYRADHLFRAVRLPAGRSEVRFVYQAGSTRSGALVSGLALVFLMLAAVLSHPSSNIER
ncbi:MAG: hypothetical protein U1B80_07985, partial [Anaerolineaceae bacterium]|nr:hypothetical protein [Anaerolineaceae bacterium]